MSRSRKLLTPEQRSAAMARGGRRGALVAWSNGDQAARIREGQVRRFERIVDPDGLLPEDVRRRRAETARRAWLREISMRRRPGVKT